MRRFSNHVAASCCWSVAGMAFGLHCGQPRPSLYDAKTELPQSSCVMLDMSCLLHSDVYMPLFPPMRVVSCFMCFMPGDLSR